eukprot:1321839-Amorphochlora_amoeboformis.AAC.1
MNIKPFQSGPRCLSSFEFSRVVLLNSPFSNVESKTASIPHSTGFEARNFRENTESYLAIERGRRRQARVNLESILEKGGGRKCRRRYEGGVRTA